MSKNLVLAVLLVFTVYGLNYAATTADFLKMSVGGRATAMGECFSGIADDASSIYWNPAGLINLKSREAIAMYNQFLLQEMYMFCGFGMPMKGGLAVGGMVSYFAQPAFELTDDLGNKIDTVSPNDMAVGIGVAKKINERLSIGVVGKYISSTLYQKSATGFAGDAGIFYVLKPEITIGASIKNLGTKMKWNIEEYDLPMIIGGGVAYKKQMSKENTLRVTGEVNQIGKQMKIGVGGEYTFNMIAVRGGYLVGDVQKSFTAGAGINYQGIQIDFAYVPYKILGDTFIVSIGYTFK